MKLKISLKNLLKVCNLAQVVNNSFAAKNKKDYIALKCENYQLITSCNDGSISVKLTLDHQAEQLEIIQEGKIYVSAKIIANLTEILKEQKPQQLIEIFKTENNSFNLISGKYKCNDLPLISDPELLSDDFEINNYELVNLKKSFLEQIYDRFKDFVKLSNDNFGNINNAIQGINLVCKNQTLAVCSTDAFSVVYGKFDKFKNQDFEINLLPNTLSKILSLLHDQDPKIDVYISNHNIIVMNQELKIKGRLIQGQYPSFLHWFDSVCDHHIQIKNKQLLIFKLACLFVDPQQKPKIVSLEIKDNNLKIHNFNQNNGLYVEDDLEITNVTKTEFAIAFDYDKLVLLLKKIDDNEISFQFISDVKPAIIRSLKKEPNFQQILLPNRNY